MIHSLALCACGAALQWPTQKQSHSRSNEKVSVRTVIGHTSSRSFLGIAAGWGTYILKLENIAYPVKSQIPCWSAVIRHQDLSLEPWRETGAPEQLVSCILAFCLSLSKKCKKGFECDCLRSGLGHSHLCLDEPDHPEWFKLLWMMDFIH